MIEKVEDSVIEDIDVVDLEIDVVSAFVFVAVFCGTLLVAVTIELDAVSLPVGSFVFMIGEFVAVESV